MRSIKTFLIILSLLTVTSCYRQQDARISSAKSMPDAEQRMEEKAPASPLSSSTRFVTATVTPAEMSAGGSAEATVTIAIQHGYHINANPPTFSYLKATEVSVENGDAVLVGFIIYPNALTKKFSFAEQPLAVYEGEVAIKLMLKAAKGAAKKTYSLPAKLKVQACDDQVCYPPGTIDIPIPATIK